MNRTIEERHIRTGLFILASIWLIWVAAKYAQMFDQLPPRLVETTLINLKALFLWQFIGFLVILASYVVKPLDQFRSKILLFFFTLSFLYVLSIPRDWGFTAGILVFGVWWISALMTIRYLLRMISPRIATWGLSAGFLVAALIPVWFFLGLGGILNLWTVGIVFSLLAIPGFWLSKQEIPGTVRNLVRHSGRLSALGFTSLELIFILLTITFVWTNSPEAGSDSARSHLPLAQNIVSSGSITQYFVNWGRFMPKAAQTWSSVAIIVGGVQLSKWLSWMYLVFSGVLISEEMFRRTRNQTFSVMSTAIVLSCPFITYLATTLYIDHLILLLNLTALILVFRSRGSTQTKIMILSAVVMGSLVQIKYNTLLFAMVWSGTVVWYLFTSFRVLKAIKWSLLIALVFIVCAAPWYVFTYLNTGNPIYPYFDRVFDSPLWPDGVKTTLGQDKYFLGETGSSWVWFPWIVTFLTSQVSNRHDGIMGFWMLGLIPLGLIGLSRNWFNRSLELVLTGTAGILMICLFTLNSRYWLPAYPLLICGLLLGAYEATERMQIRFPRDFKLAASLVLIVLILLTIPFWTSFNSLGLFPWQVYSGEKSKQEWLDFLYPGTPAIESFNQFVEKDDGVLCTNYEAVYAVNSRAYEFPFWHTNILELRSPDDFVKFAQKNRLHYWLVNLRQTDDNHFFNGRFDTYSRFWTDNRLVAASHQIAIFDISENPGPARLREITRQNSKLSLCEPDSSQECTGWNYIEPKDLGMVKELGKGKIELPPDGNLTKVFPIPETSSLVEFSIGATAGKSTTLILSLEWLNHEGKQTGLIQGGISSRLKYDRFKGPIYGNIPSDAVSVRIRIRPWNSTVSVFEPQLRFLGSLETKETD